MRSASAGALLGDPERPYLILYPPAGNGIFVSWPEVVEAWEAIWPEIQAFGDFWGAGQPFFWALRKAREVFQRKGTDWEERGGTPGEVREWIQERDVWRLSDLSAFLSCGEEEAKWVLYSHGFTPGEGEEWSKAAENQEAALANSLKELVLLGQDRFSEEELKEYTAEILEEYVDDGRVIPVDTEFFIERMQ